MSRWFRWQFLVPRLLVVVVAVLGVQYGLGQLARSVAIRSGEAFVGAPVDVGHARISFADRQVVFSDLSFANPRCPTEQWLRADRCELYVAVAPLLHKQTMIDRGRISGLRFETSSVANEGTSAGNSPVKSPVGKWFHDNSDEAARARLASIDQHFKRDLVNEFESVRRTDALCARWPVEAAALDERALKLKRRAGQLQESTDAAQANHLRHGELLNDLPAELAALRQEFQELSDKVEKLPQGLDDARREIVAARRQDEQLLRERLRLEPIDQEMLTAYLLREQLMRPVNELIGWLRWSQQAGESAGRQNQNRGESILFAGVRRSPDFLIRALEIDGEAQIMNRPVVLRGLLSNFTPTPSLHKEPLRLSLRASGSMPLELRATIDRTGPVARDELLVDCHAIPLPELFLGRSDQLELRLAPSVGSLSVSLSVEGEKLSGDIQLVQTQVRITPVLGGQLRDVPLAAPLEATLGEVNLLATRIALQGTLDEPSCTLWSNLSSAVAEALDRALRRCGDEHAQALLAEARRQVDERLAALERQVADQQMRFASEMTSMPTRFDNIAQQQTRRERISIEQLGRRLPSNSLFR